MYTLFPLLCPAGLSDLQTDGKQSDSREPSSPSSSESVGPPEQPGASNVLTAAQHGHVGAPGRGLDLALFTVYSILNGNEVSRKKNKFQSVLSTGSDITPPATQISQSLRGA